MRLLPFDYAVRNLSRSPLRLVLSVAGSALVVMLALAAGSFVRGMNNSLRSSSNPANVILLGAGSEESLERSEIRPDVPGLLQGSVSGIRSRLGVAFVSPEVQMQTALRESRESNRELTALLRGFTPPAFLVHPQVRVIEGRVPEAGRDEIMLGKLVGTKVGLGEDRLAVGQTLWLDKRTWTIVGRFEAPNTVMEAEVWLPLGDLQIFARRQNLSCVVVTMDSPAGFDDVDLFAKQRLDLELVALRETDYYSALSAFYRPIQIMIWATAILIAIGGLFGGLNTMYAAFASRVRELGSLQTLGYSRLAIVISLVQESVLAAAAGALIGCLIALFVLDGLAVRFSMGAFGLTLDSTVLALGLTAGLLLGLIGALPPAWRCLRLPITVALKSA